MSCGLYYEYDQQCVHHIWYVDVQFKSSSKFVIQLQDNLVGQQLIDAFRFLYPTERGYMCKWMFFATSYLGS